MVANRVSKRGQVTAKDIIRQSDGDDMVSTSYLLDCKMVIEIINDNAINGMPLSEESN